MFTDLDGISQMTWPKSAMEVRARFDELGITYKSWADGHHIDVQTVYSLLHEPTWGKYGEAHRAKKLLGMKGQNPDPVLWPDSPDSSAEELSDASRQSSDALSC